MSCKSAHNICDGMRGRVKRIGKFPPMIPRAGGMGSATASHLQLSMDMAQLATQIIRGHGPGRGMNRARKDGGVRLVVASWLGKKKSMVIDTKNHTINTIPATFIKGSWHFPLSVVE